MRMRRAQQPRVQHARQLHVDGVAARAGHLGAAVDARHRLADHGQACALGGERRRLVGGNARSISPSDTLAMPSGIFLRARVGAPWSGPSVARRVERRRRTPADRCRSGRGGRRSRPSRRRRRMRIALEQRRAAHHQAGRAEAALHRVVRDEGGLHRVQRIALGQALDGGDLARRRRRARAVMQEATGAPSSQTVQAEQAPRSQPILVPVSSSASRKASARVVLGSTESAQGVPLTLRVMGTASGPTVSSSAACATPSGRVSSKTVVAAPTPEPRRNERRDICPCCSIDLVPDYSLVRSGRQAQRSHLPRCKN